jgi:hypothetical protein
MQSASNSNTSSGEERPSHPKILTHLEGFSITLMDASALKGYLEEFKNADTESWTKIIAIATGKIYALRPPNATFDKKEAMKVSILMFFAQLMH